MKKILTIVLAMMMLLSCVACSNTNSNDTMDSTELLPGSKYPLPSELPMEMRPLQADDKASDKKPFENDDPRKKYLEEKYGLTAYLVEERTESRITTLFTLEGYEKTFHLYTKEDLIDSGVSAEDISGDYIDNAYFTVAYSEIYEYFNQAIEASGVAVDRLIIKERVRYYATSIYDLNKSFAECLASTDNKSYKRFEIRLYGDFGSSDDAYGKLFMELQKLDFVGTVSFYNTLQDISGLTNDDLMNYTTSKDYVVSSYPMQQIK